ncbi:uncharacterized protein LOC114872496 isoform X2 [Osmia bicornis bicornis]|uniref:uncharacterized protein LOC114872496 isoform X2 n=1 Tax=Osmia bicornis bicornis TaxID=1437191 RepID=UPI0010F57147|nr:uncharacterized protein LOC114872496 isoform X2 [Osmia bicornis bicornis]
MFHIRLVKQFRSIKIRQFHSTLIKYEDKVVPENKSTKPSPVQENILGSPFHTVTNLDKRILVWVKRYPSIDQVPDKVSVYTKSTCYSKSSWMSFYDNTCNNWIYGICLYGEKGNSSWKECNDRKIKVV